jgi:peptidoglycan/LPS O-acetylase OafA/YrhL
MLACLYPAWRWMSPEGLKSFGQSLVAVSLFANNILLSVTSGYWDLASDEKPLLHTWSLGVEEQYYVLFPILLATIWRVGRKRMAALLYVLLLLSVCVAEWGWRTFPIANFYLPITRAWELLSGALVAFALHFQGPLSAKRLGAKNGISLLGMALIAYSIFWFDGRTPFPSLYSIVPTLGSVLVLYVADEQTFVGRVLSRPLLVGIGLISYSLYLWHQPLLAYARVVSGRDPGVPSSLLLMSCALALAYVTWRFVEKPFRDRAFLSRRQVFAAALGGAVVFSLIGLLLNVKHGFPRRLPEAYLSEVKQFEALKVQRQKWYEHGCKLSLRTVRTIGKAAENWNCLVQPEEAQVLVVGDSHAEDKAVALRANGVAVDQVIGSDCSLTPSLMEYRCRSEFDALVSSAAMGTYRFLLLANRWEDIQEVRAFAVQARYWRRGNAYVILFGGMPEFGKIADRMATLVGRGLTRREAALTYRYDGKKAGQVDDELRKVAKEQGFIFIDTAAAFCQLSSSLDACIPLVGERYLVIDYAHLSELGANLLGGSIVRQMTAIGRLDVAPTESRVQ